jgi:16S rRNA processing protein RimM
MSLVLLGRLGRPHGIHGEIVLDGCSLDVEELRRIREFVWRGRDGAELALTLRSVRAAMPRTLVAFAGYDVREAVAELTNGQLHAEESRLPDAGPDTVYQFQLLGLEVVTVEGRALGAVVDAFPTGAHWIYVVRGADQRELMIPAIPENVKEVDLTARRVVVALPPGLEEAR